MFGGIHQHEMRSNSLSLMSLVSSRAQWKEKSFIFWMV